jgi:hypothetical protein
MSWMAVCDKCGVSHLSGQHPDIPERWTQLHSGRLYCTESDCDKAAQRAFKRQRPKEEPQRREPRRLLPENDGLTDEELQSKYRIPGVIHWRS